MLSSKKGKIRFLGGAGIFLLIFGVWFLVLSPRTASVEEMNIQAETIVSQTANDEANLKKIQKLALDAPAAASRAQVLFNRMPYTVNPGDALTVFDDVISGAGIKSENLQSLTAGVPTQIKTTSGAAKLPGLGENSGNIAEIPVSLSIKTTQVGLFQLIVALEKMDRIFIINSFSLANKQGTDEISVQIKGSVFILQSALPDIVGEIDKLLLDANIVSSSNTSNVANSDELILEDLTIGPDATSPAQPPVTKVP